MGKIAKSESSLSKQDDGTIMGEARIKTYITIFYKLFGPSVTNFFSIDEAFTGDIAQIIPEENAILTSLFTEKEVNDVDFQMEHNKAPEPDGFPAEFYQIFWQVLKWDLMALFTDFQQALFPLFQLNFGVITMLPKKKDTSQIQQYHAI